MRLNGKWVGTGSWPTAMRLNGFSGAGTDAGTVFGRVRVRGQRLSDTGAWIGWVLGFSGSGRVLGFSGIGRVLGFAGSGRVLGLAWIGRGA